MNIVFTGRGFRAGRFVTRDVWYATARRHGHAVQDAVDYGTDILVASRMDTSKARHAQSLRVSVLTYDQWDRVQHLGEAAIRDMMQGRVPPSGTVTGRTTTPPPAQTLPPLAPRPPRAFAPIPVPPGMEVVEGPTGTFLRPVANPLIPGVRQLDLDD